MTNTIKEPNQDRHPNFREKPNALNKGKLFLVRCFVCDTNRGLENYAPSVATGRCAWCGWHESQNKEVKRATSKRTKSV